MRRFVVPLAVAVTVAFAAGAIALTTGGRDSPPVTADPTVHFTAAGDYSTEAATKSVLSKVGEIGPDLHLALGDLSNGGTGREQDWCDLVTRYVGTRFPFEVVSGDDESNGQHGNIDALSSCLPNQLPGAVGAYGRQWYVDVPARNPVVRFVMISPGLKFPAETYDYSVGTPRYTWTAGVIDGARAASIPWVVVGMHKPCLTTGKDPCGSGTDLLNLLLSKKVDLVLQGHARAYERTKQLALGPGCQAVVPGPADKDCIADAGPGFVKGAGTVFATVGTGGFAQHPLNPTSPEAPYFATTSGKDTATWGPLDVEASSSKLSASFERAAGGSFTDAFTIRPAGPGQNVAPMASFTAGCELLVCAVDATGSSDPDGAVRSYGWDFGDGQTGTGQTARHTYRHTGSYTVTLTVTDSDGAKVSTTHTLSPNATGGPPPFAADSFSRTSMRGFGSAETGGTWLTTGDAATFTVSSGVGRIVLPAPSDSADLALPTRAVPQTDLTFSVSTDRSMTGGGLHVLVGVRRVPGVGEYRAKVQLSGDGSVLLSLVRVAGKTTETVLVPAAPVPGVAYAAGDRLLVHVQATGSAPTTLRARVWKFGTPEPGWLATAVDPTPELQGTGSIGLNFYLSSTSAAPLRVFVDDIVGRVP